MDTFPDISMPPEVKEDLEIIETEDLKSDPFVRQPPLIPPAPTPVVPKPKRQVSEKQKAHLANARKMAKERKLAKKKEDAEKKEQEPKKQDIKEYATPLPIKSDVGLPVSQGSAQVDGFEQFLGYMDKYGDMMVGLQKEEKRKREEAERKEKEMEEKYFKKFQEQQQTKKTMPKPKEHEPLIERETYGDYSNYF